MPFRDSTKDEYAKEQWIYHALAIIAISLCFFNMPYGYYKAFKVLMMIYCLFNFAAYKGISLIPFVIIVVLFNPIIPIPLNRGQWQILDIATIGFMVIRIAFDFYILKNEKTT